MKFIEITPGEDIGNVAVQMAAIATREGRLIAANFNDIFLTAKPFETPASILARYDQELKKRQDEYRAEKEGEERIRSNASELQHAISDDEINKRIEWAYTALEAYNRNPNLFTGAAMANALEKLISLFREIRERQAFAPAMKEES